MDLKIGNVTTEITSNSIRHIMKRDGRKAIFYKSKIVKAVQAAINSTDIHDSELAQNIADIVTVKLNNTYVDSIPTVENIQNLVEDTLMELKEFEIARAYIIYRSQRTKIRDTKTRLMKIYHGIAFQDAKENDLKRDNANVDGNTAMGSMLKYGSEGSKEFAKLFIMKPEHTDAHENGDIHIHDLDFLPMGTLTCCQIDVIKLFQNGFSTGHGHLREPNDIYSYCALAAIALQSNQNEQHGGQSIPNFDYAMADGVKKTFKRNIVDNVTKILKYCGHKDIDKDTVKQIINEMTQKLGDGVIHYPDLDESAVDYIKEASSKHFSIDVDKKDIVFAIGEAQNDTIRTTYQAMEALIHNLNTMHSRAGAQVPFTSINFGTDTSNEGHLVSEQFLKATWAGLGNGETPIFPISIFKVKEGINYNEGDPNYDLFKLSIKVSAKRLYPNFVFIDAPFNLKYYKKGDYRTEAATMGCRTRVMSSVFPESDGIVTGRGNNSFTSINLPRLGIKHGIITGKRTEPDLKGFYKDLDEKIDLVIDQLLERYEIQCSKQVKNFPFLMGQGIWMGSENFDCESTLREAVKHGTLSAGFIGLAETLKALTGKHHGESAESQKLGLEIISHMRKRLDDAAKQYTLNFSLLATPAEGLSGRFVKMDKKRYGKIPGVTDREYYTNSFHIPVYYNIGAFDKIQLEAPYHDLCNAGHITYVELDGDPLNNLEAFESLIRAMKEAGVGYGSINHPVDRDPVCGYNGIIGDTCPKCGRAETDDDIPFERLRRITGYLVGTLDRWNNAKRAEEKDRVKHGLTN